MSSTRFCDTTAFYKFVHCGAVDHNPGVAAVERVPAKLEESVRPDRGSCSPTNIVDDCGEMIKPANENLDDQGVEEAAEHAERADAQE